MSSIADDEDSNSNNHCDTDGGNKLARKTVSQMSLSFNLKYNSAGEDSASEQAPRTFLSYLKLILSYAKFFLRLFGWGLLGMLPSPASVQFELLTDFKKSEISSQNNARHRVCKKRNSKESKIGWVLWLSLVALAVVGLVCALALVVHCPENDNYYYY